MKDTLSFHINKSYRSHQRKKTMQVSKMDGSTKSQSQFLQSVLYSARLKDAWALERTAVQSSDLRIHSWTNPAKYILLLQMVACWIYLLSPLTLKTSFHNDPDKSKLTLLQVTRVAAAEPKPLGNVIGINSCGNSSCKIQFNHTWWRTFSLCAFPMIFPKGQKKANFLKLEGKIHQ